MIGQTLSLVGAMYDALGIGFLLALAFPGFVALGIVLIRAALRRERPGQELAGD